MTNLLRLPNGSYIVPEAVVAVYLTCHDQAPCGQPWEVRVGFHGWTLLVQCFPDEASARVVCTALSNDINEACITRLK